MPKTKFLEVGDVFAVEKGMRFYDKPSGGETKASAGDVGNYVVVDARQTGGGTGHGPHDVYPDGWYITARQLLESGSYNSKGRRISFYQSGCFTVMHERVSVIRKMTATFI